MKSDLFIRTLLIITVTLLALNILLPILSNPPTSYAAKNIEYKVIYLDQLEVAKNPGKIEEILNEYSKKGWEYTDCITMWSSSRTLIFKR